MGLQGRRLPCIVRPRRNNKMNRGSAMNKPAAGIRPFATRRLPAIALIFIAAALTSARAQTLDVPARSVPVPGTVSPQLAKIIGAPLRTNWNVLPKTGEEWKPVAEAG